MKKIATLLIFAFVIGLVSCGLSEKEREEKARLDSMKRVADENAKLDSIQKATLAKKYELDSIASAEAAKLNEAHKDSVAKGLIKGEKKTKK
jgi:flagellar biosynthesis/type III secretory pathway protein FliH